MTTQLENQKWFAIVNPTSGNGKSGKKWQQVMEALKAASVNFEYRLTTRAREAEQIVVQALESGFTKIISVGGDGNLHDIANGLLKQTIVPANSVTLAIISLGTGNDFVKHYGISTKIKQAISLLQTGKTVLHDAGLATSQEDGIESKRYFVNFCGVGFDAFVVERAAAWKPYGQIAYLLGTIRWLFAYKKPLLRFVIDEKTIETVSYLSLAGIGKYSGGGMQLTPCAKANDGKFSFTLAKDLSKLDVILKMKMLYDGSICSHSEVDCLEARQIKIEVLEEHFSVKMQADGDVLGTGPFTVTSIPQALRILVPENYNA